MKFIRWFLGKIILTLNALFSPRSLVRPVEEQAKIDQATQTLALYQFNACPFCVKVRRSIKRLGLKIELRDTQNNPKYAQELREQGGQVQVPCLKIHTSEKTQWLYESSDIIAYLESHFS